MFLTLGGHAPLPPSSLGALHLPLFLSLSLYIYIYQELAFPIKETDYDETIMKAL
jgi:hypothetical protein